MVYDILSEDDDKILFALACKQFGRIAMATPRQPSSLLFKPCVAEYSQKATYPTSELSLIIFLNEI